MTKLTSVICAGLFVSCLGLAGCTAPVTEDVPITDYDESEMDAAIAKARESIDEFLAVMNANNGENFAVKAPITDDNGTEHFWLSDVTFSGGQFSGRIANEPGVVRNVTNGQTWTISREDISDWMYFRDDKMYGNYTLGPLLKTLPEAEADAWRSIRAEP